jgi:protein ImuB
VAEELDKVASVVDRIANDIGPENVWRPAPFASHVPERAVVKEPPFHKVPPWERDPTQPRPIRLLRRPEPIDVTAPMPDDPPILFRWRKRVHRIRAATGPERIAAEWWRSRQGSANDLNQERKRQAEREETDLLRDYYQVEDTDGARFWVFRTGLHADGHPARWFLHGLFG